jgi:hypothetical protein
VSDQLLKWETADTEEPGDQNAPSARVHGWYAIGPTGDGRWSCELIEVDDGLNEVPTGGADLGAFPSESAAKDAAQSHEVAS